MRREDPETLGQVIVCFWLSTTWLGALDRHAQPDPYYPSRNSRWIDILSRVAWATCCPRDCLN
jgi:hypothetical protein